MLAGSFCTAAAVLPPIASHDELFPVHVGQHLLLGMAAPAFLAMSAPVTLALRTLPRRPRRILLRLLHGFPVAVLAAPATAVVLNLGGHYALYPTGLYQAAEHDDLVHAAVHMHMFLAGCLLSWAVIGLDPVRRRPGTWVRLTALIIAAAGTIRSRSSSMRGTCPSAAPPSPAAIRDDRERTGEHDVGPPSSENSSPFSSCRWTRASPQFWRCATNSKSWPNSGWNRCVTRTRRYRLSGQGVVDDVVQLLCRTLDRRMPP